jgi:hypothetical protein
VRQARGCPSGIRTMTAIKIVSISLLLHAIYPGGNCASVQYCSQVWSALLIMTRPRSRGGTAATALQRVLVDVEHDPAEDRQRRAPGLLLPPSDRRLCNFGIFWLGGEGSVSSKAVCNTDVINMPPGSLDAPGTTNRARGAGETRR